MRILLLTIFSFTVTLTNAQDFFVDDKCSMEGVVQVDSVSADNLYARAKYVMAKVFKSANDVTQLDDADNKQVIAKGINYVNTKNPFNPDGGLIRFTYQIQCRDGRYKYTITDCVHEKAKGYKYSGGTLCQDKPDCGTFMMPKSAWNNIKKDFIKQMELVIADMKREMANPASNNSDKDW